MRRYRKLDIDPYWNLPDPGPPSDNRNPFGTADPNTWYTPGGPTWNTIQHDAWARYTPDQRAAWVRRYGGGTQDPFGQPYWVAPEGQIIGYSGLPGGDPPVDYSRGTPSYPGWSYKRPGDGQDSDPKRQRPDDNSDNNDDSSDYRYRTSNMGQPTTYQNDHESLYRKSRSTAGSRRRSKSLRRFQSKVINAIDSMSGIQRCYMGIGTTASNFGFSSSTLGAQAVYDIASIYMVGKSGTAGFRDLEQIFSQTGAAVATEKTYHFRSAATDISITCGGLVNTTVDLYYLVCRQDLPNSVTGAALPSTLFAQSIATDYPANYSAAAQLSTNQGADPFQARTFCQYWKIYKVERVRLAPNTKVQTGLSDYRNHKLTSDISITQDLIAKAGLSRCIMAIHYGDPLAGTGATAGQAQISTIDKCVSTSYTFTDPTVLDAGNQMFTP